MIRYGQTTAEAEAPPESAAPATEEHIAPAPRISIQAFCDTVEAAGAMQGAAEDRRLARAHVRIHMGGMAAALEAYRSAPTPNVIVIESDKAGESLLGALDELAEVCDGDTRLIVIGVAGPRL